MHGSSTETQFEHEPLEKGTLSHQSHAPHSDNKVPTWWTWWAWGEVQGSKHAGGQLHKNRMFDIMIMMH